MSTVRRLSHLTRSPLPMLSSDGMTPSLVASSEPNFPGPSSSYGEQTRTGFFIPSTPMDHSSLFLSSPGIASGSFGNPFQSSPASSSKFVRRKNRSSLADSSIDGLRGTKAWTGKGSLYNVLTEAGQGRTIIKCRIVNSTDFARKSTNTRSNRRDYDENDGLAALAMQEGGSADSDLELESERQSSASNTGWGCLVEIRLRNLAQPITLDQTARLRSAVFGERPKPAMYRRVAIGTARQQEASEKQKTGRETRRSRLTTDRIGSTGSLARKTPGQMADAMLPSDVANRSSLGFSSLGIDGSEMGELDDEDDVDAKMSSKRTGLTRPVQRYPAALSASSSLKRKSLIIPHDRIPLNRRGPNLAADKKRRKLNREDDVSFGAVSVVDDLPQDPESKPIRSLEMRPALKVIGANSITPEPTGEVIFDDSPAELSSSAGHGPSLFSSLDCRQSQRTSDVKPLVEPFVRRSITLQSIPSIPSNPARFPVRQGLKRTLSEIAERESKKHVARGDHEYEEISCLEPTQCAVLQTDEMPSLHNQQDRVHASLDHAEPGQIHVSVSTQSSHCLSQAMITLPLSDDSSTLGQTRDFSAPPAIDWLDAPGLDCLFDLSKQALPALNVEPMTGALDLWDVGASTAAINTQLDAGYTFTDDAFSFFDLSYGGIHDSSIPSKQSPFDFSQLPPSSPPQSECDFQHSVLLLSSPEDSSAG